MIQTIKDLNLLTNQQHSRSIAAAVAAWCWSHPEEDWAKHPDETVRRALSICPTSSILFTGDDEDQIQHPHQVLQHMVWWMITGDTDILADVTDLCQRADHPLQEYAQETLQWFQERHDDLGTLPEGDASPDVVINEKVLAEIIGQLPEEYRSRVTFVVEREEALLVGVRGLEQETSQEVGGKRIRYCPDTFSKASKSPYQVASGV